MENNKNYVKIAIFAITFIIIWTIIIFLSVRIGKTNSRVDESTVSIHMYNERSAFVKYLMVKNTLKNQIIKDLLDGKEIDTVVLNQLELNENLNIDLSYDSLIKMTNNSLGEWYMSINYMFMDNNYDSTCVKNSDTYKITLPMIDSLKSK